MGSERGPLWRKESGWVWYGVDGWLGLANGVPLRAIEDGGTI